MRVSHFLEMEDKVVGGIREAVKNQRKALEKAGIEYTAKPDLSADVFHVHSTGPRSLYYILKAKRKDIPTVVNVHTTAEDFKNSFRFSRYVSPALRPYLKYFYSQADLLVAPSQYTKNLLLEEYNFEEENVVSVSNGIDTQKLEGYNSIDEESLEYHDDSTTVFCVGSVFERKGVSDFVEVAEELPELDFIWFGKIFEEKMLNKQAREAVKNPPDNVEFTGYVDDIREAYAVGDIFFFPTHIENQGIPALESAYCRKPIILRDIEPFKQDFEHEENCLKGRNNEEFVEQIKELKESKNLREQLSDNAKHTAKQHTLEKVSKKLRSTYESLDVKIEQPKKIPAQNQ